MTPVTEAYQAIPNLSSIQSPCAILAWQRYAFPIDWQTQFASDSLTLHLEIGFGDGRYTVRRALNEPGHFVALEITNASIDRAYRRLQREGVNNIYFLNADGMFALQQLFSPHSLESITVNFPDPWPKSRHEGKRLLKKAFFELAASRLKPKGQIRLASDAKDYVEFAQAEASASGFYQLLELPPPQAVFETKYALKWKSQGRPLYYQVFEYNGHPSPDYPILERNIAMPHAILAGQLPKAVPFSKFVTTYQDTYIIIEEVSQSWSQHQERLLAKVVVDEKGLRQNLLVVVAKRQDDNLLARFDTFSDPIITKGSRGAIHGVTEWLISLEQGLRVLERNYL